MLHVDGCLGGFHVEELLSGDGIAEHDADAAEGLGEFFSDGPKVEWAFEGGGHDDGFGATDDELHAFLETVEFAIGGASAFGEDEEHLLVFEEVDGVAEAFDVVVFLIDGDGVDGSNVGAEKFVAKERGACKGVEVTVRDAHADERWVDEGLVVA